METRIYNDLALHGSLVMSKDESGFPESPSIGTMIIKDQCLYAYIKIGGMETWYPFANKTNSYVHVQAVDSLTWIVNHNLGTSDVWIQVKDQNGNIVQVGKTTIDQNSFQLNFTQASRGTVVVVAPDTIDVPAVKATAINVANSVVIIDNSGIRVNGSYVLTSANIDQQISDAVAAETARATGVEGSLASLTTTAKTNLVSAINEVKSLLPVGTGVRYAGAFTGTFTDTNAGALYYVTSAYQVPVYDGSIGIVIDTVQLNPGDFALLIKNYPNQQSNTQPGPAVVKINNSGAVGTSANLTSVVGSTSSTTPNAVIDEITATSARSVKYLVQVTSGSSYHTTEILVVHNGTSVSMTQYGVVTTSGELASFDADISNSKLRLLVTPASGAVTVYRVVRLAIVS